MFDSAHDDDGGTKRQKTVHPNPIAGINDLSNDSLIAIADFLPKSSRALFAVALTAPAWSWRERGWKVGPSAASRLVVSSLKRCAPFSSLIRGICMEDEMGDRCRLRRGVSLSHYNDAFEASLEQQLREYYEGQWEILDFVDIGRTLASRLTDDDIGATLLCIDAKNNLKRLKLAHCFNIVGHGLNPLRCSHVLEKIDMGLVRQFEAPEMFDGARVSQEAVFDVIDSILSVGQNSFGRLQVPMKWWKWSGNDVIPGEGLVRRLKKHKHVLNKRSICCYFGFGGDGGEFLERMGAADEDPVDTCVDCADRDYFEACADCGRILCGECECNFIYKCEYCHAGSCNACIESSDNTVSFCTSDNCNYCCCAKCRLNECRECINNCDGCRSLAFDKLLEENSLLRIRLESLRL